jgi:ceramide glucosyltransferase
VIWLAAPALAAAAYYLLAIIAAARWRGVSGAAAQPADPPPVSILKPVRGRDPRFYEAIRSHAEQDYPEFEMLFGVAASFPSGAYPCTWSRPPRPTPRPACWRS